MFKLDSVVFVCVSLAVRESGLSCGKFADTHASLLEKEASVRQLKHKQAMLRLQSQTRQLIEGQRNHAAMDSNREVQIKDHDEKVREEESQGGKHLWGKQGVWLFAVIEVGGAFEWIIHLLY